MTQMTPQEFMTQILKAEHHAKSMRNQAVSAQSALEGELKAEIAAMHDRYYARADANLAELQRQADAAADHTIAELDAKLAQNLSRVETVYQNNREQWIETIFRMVVES